MTLSTVTLQWSIPDLIQSGLSGTLTITPSYQMSDATDHELIPSVARSVVFSGGTGQLAGIVANDNANILPAGTGYLITVVASNGQVIVPQFQTQILYANGATQWLDQLATVPTVTTSFQYLPLPSGTPSSGEVPVATGTGAASTWTPVLQLAGGTMTGPISMGSQKITSPGGYDPVTSGFTCFATGGAPQDLNTTSGTSSTMTSGEWYYAALMVPYDCTLTGLIFTASVGSGTDKWVAGLFGPTGAPVANSATAGTVTPGTAGKFKIPFTSPAAVAGPCVYYAGVQSNGTTAKFLSFGMTVEGFVTGTASGVFGTIPTLSLATTYTQNAGPYATTY